MTAAEYYNGAPLRPTSLAPAAFPQQQPLRQSSPSSYSLPPPPYSPGLQYQQQRPAPYLNPQPASYSHPTPYLQPPPTQYAQPQTPQYLQQQPYPPNQQQQYSAGKQQFQQQFQQQYQQQPQGTLKPPHPQFQPQAYPPNAYDFQPASQHAFYHQNNAGDQGYSSDPESRRRRHKHHKRPASRDKRSGVSGLATTGLIGGALAGDLIFPGLGTTLVGGLGGWYAGKQLDKSKAASNGHKRHRDRSRDRYD